LLFISTGFFFTMMLFFSCQDILIFYISILALLG
jgi:hypothetical protein